MLTGKQDRFARLVAEGELPQWACYAEAYDADNSLCRTMIEEASRLFWRACRTSTKSGGLVGRGVLLAGGGSRVVASVAHSGPRGTGLPRRQAGNSILLAVC